MTTPAPFPATARRLIALESAGHGPFHLAIDAHFHGVAPDRLAQGIDALVRRHEALRTGIEFGADGPLQRIHSDVPPLRVVSLGGRQLEVTIDAVGAAHREALAVPGAPLFQAGVIATGPTESAVIVTAHHAVIDGASLPVLLQDLSDLLAGDPAREAPASYSDFARREAAYLDGDASRADLDHWRKALAFPDWRWRERWPAIAPTGRLELIGADMLGRLEARGRAHGAGLAAALVACAASALAEAAGPRMLVGCTVANRRGVLDRSVVGLLSHSLPVPVALGPDRSAAAALAASARALSQAYRRGRTPLAEIVRRTLSDLYLAPHELAPVQVNLFPSEHRFASFTFAPILHRALATAAHEGLSLFIARQSMGALVVASGAGRAPMPLDDFLAAFKDVIAALADDA